jgi:cytochrome c-type biogenesis protein CcmH
MRKYILLTFFYLMSVGAQDIPMEFDDPQQQQRYKNLTEELRCLVCQNQSLADSNAPLAQDLRTEVYNMIEAGQSNDEILEFLVARYGDFVLYRPPLTGYTVLLWFGPFLLLIIALVVVYRQAKAKNLDDISISEAQRTELEKLMKAQGPDNPA